MNEHSVNPARPRRVLMGVLFVAYLGLLVWLVLWKLHLPYIGRDDMREIKLVPFVRSSGFGPSAPAEVVANLLLFIPFGAYLRILVPSWNWWRSATTIAAASLALEVAQYVLAAGSSDVTDVIVNTAGGVIGIAVASLAARSGLSV